MKKRILIIDDDHTFNFLNAKLFSAAGIVSELHVALHGKEALDLFENYFNKKASPPEIILLDIHMPVMNGIQFIEAFQRLNFAGKEKITIIVFTSSLNPKDTERAAALGIRYFLNKPYVLKGVEEIIRTINILESRETVLLK